MERLRDPPSLDPSSGSLAVRGGPMSSTSTTSKKVRPSKATCSLSYLPVSRLWIFEKVESATFSKRPTSIFVYMYLYTYTCTIHVHVASQTYIFLGTWLCKTNDSLPAAYTVCYSNDKPLMTAHPLLTINIGIEFAGLS